MINIRNMFGRYYLYIAYDIKYRYNNLIMKLN